MPKCGLNGSNLGKDTWADFSTPEYATTKQPNLKLKTQPKLFLGSIMLTFEFPSPPNEPDSSQGFIQKSPNTYRRGIGIPFIYVYQLIS